MHSTLPESALVQNIADVLYEYERLECAESVFLILNTPSSVFFFSFCFCFFKQGQTDQQKSACHSTVLFPTNYNFI